MTSDVRKTIEAWIKQAQDAGWEIVPNAGPAKHWKLRSPSGEMVTLPATPNGGKGILNARAKLRRAGLAVR